MLFFLTLKKLSKKNQDFTEKNTVFAMTTYPPPPGFKTLRQE
jgi:hypothetical protein